MEEIKSIPVEKNVRVSAQLEKLTESLRDWMQRPAPMKNLVKFARHAQAANRHLNDAAFGQLVAYRHLTSGDDCAIAGAATAVLAARPTPVVRSGRGAAKAGRAAKIGPMIVPNVSSAKKAADLANGRRRPS